MHDLVIRNGMVVDGTGRPGRAADEAIDAGRITTVYVATIKSAELTAENGELIGERPGRLIRGPQTRG